MPVYAAPEDFTDPPENIDTMIVLASRLVEDATLTAFYTVDADCVPTNDDIRARFKAATVAQVNYWQELGIKPGQGAAGITEEGRVSTKSIGSESVSYEFRNAQQNMNDRLAALTNLGPEALAILGHLAHGRVMIRG